MLRVELPYSEIYVCEICGAPLTKEEAEQHERIGNQEVSEIRVGERVEIDDTLWRDNWHEESLPSSGWWIVKRLFYTYAASDHGANHQLFITLESVLKEIERTVPYAHFMGFLQQGKERIA